MAIGTTSTKVQARVMRSSDGYLYDAAKLSEGVVQCLPRQTGPSTWELRLVAKGYPHLPFPDTIIQSLSITPLNANFVAPTTRGTLRLCTTPGGRAYLTLNGAQNPIISVAPPFAAGFPYPSWDPVTIDAGDGVTRSVWPIPWSDTGMRLFSLTTSGAASLRDFDSGLVEGSTTAYNPASYGTTPQTRIFTCPETLGAVASYQSDTGHTYIDLIHPSSSWAGPIQVEDFEYCVFDADFIYTIAASFPGSGVELSVRRYSIADQSVVEDTAPGGPGSAITEMHAGLHLGRISVCFKVDSTPARVIEGNFGDLSTQSAVPTDQWARVHVLPYADRTVTLGNSNDPSLVGSLYEAEYVRGVDVIDESTAPGTFVLGLALPDQRTVAYTATIDNPNFEVVLGAVGQNQIVVADDAAFSSADDDPQTGTITVSGGPNAGTAAFSIDLDIPAPPGETYAPDRGPNLVEGTDLVDTAEMSGDYADYHVMYDSMTQQVVIMGPDGIDRFSDVEVFSFADGDKTLAEMISDASENTTDDLTSSPYHQVMKASTDVPYDYYEITPDNSGLPKEVRYIRAGSDGVLDVLTNQGRAVSYTVSAGEVIFGYVVAVLDTTTVTNIVGYV